MGFDLVKVFSLNPSTCFGNKRAADATPAALFKRKGQVRLPSIVVLECKLD